MHKASQLLFLLLLGSSAHAQFLQQGGKLIGPGALGASQQGYSVALAANGNTAVIGGAGDSGFTGAAWVFTRTNGVWTSAAKLAGTGASGPAQQGVAVAISADGNTVISGGDTDNGGDGAAWIFVRSGTGWVQEAKLAGSRALGSAYQGASVAISADGNTAIIGGFADNDSVGAAWVFTRIAGVWTEQGKLVGAGYPPSYQGWSVALSGDGNTAMMGGYQDDSQTGAAWIFIRAGGRWSQQGDRLVGSGAVGSAGQGSSVALSGDGNTAVLGGSQDDGGSGAAWVFTRSGAAWTQSGGKLVGGGSGDPAFQGGSVGLSIDGSTLILGGPGDNANAGSFWIFTQSGGGWVQKGGKLAGADAAGSAAQGFSVALSGDGQTALGGGYNDDGGKGAAWVFSVPASPVLSLSKTHSGAFTQGQNGAYTIVVANAGNSPATSGMVSVVDSPPVGMLISGMSGAGWNCTAAGCSRSDALAGGNAYPPISLNVGIAANAPSLLVNQAMVSGGGSSSASASDATVINPPSRAVWTLQVAHTGNFVQGQAGAYTITVVNTGTGPGTGLVLTQALPAGLSALTLVAGTGVASTNWTCSGNQCTLNGSIPPGTSSQIVSNVSVAANAPASVINSVTVGGVGYTPVSATDLTLITSQITSRPPVLTLRKTHASTLVQGQTAVYTILAANQVGAGSVNSAVTVTELPQAGITVTGMSGSGWLCTIPVCSRNETLVGGDSYPPILVAVSVAANAPSVVTNQATISGGGAAQVVASDSAKVSTTDAAQWFVTLTHTGTFIQGMAGAGYLITITNNTSLPATGLVVNEVLPAGLDLVSMSGTGWSCGGLGCTQSGALAPKANTQIQVLVNVAANAVATVNNVVSLSGGTPTLALVSADPTTVLPVTSYVFVRQLYRDLLSREPDPAGLAYWKGLLDSGALTRSQAAASFFTSPEFSNTGLYVIKTYIGGLGRDPDYVGWFNWYTGLQRGISSLAILDAFLTSTEFQNRFGQPSNQDFVTLAYFNVLGRLPDRPGQIYWLGLLNGGQLSRSTLLDSFIRGREFDDRVRNRAFAILCYMGFLRRNPDPTGLGFWQNMLDSGGTLPGLTQGFITGTEYLSRLAQIAP